MNLKDINSIGWYNTAKNIYYTTCISLETVLSNRNFITPAELSPGSGLVDANFEVNIPIQEELYTREDIDHVMLHCFVQFDAHKYIEDGNLSRTTRKSKSFISTGGNLKSKKILERTSNGLTNPEFKQVLTLQNGTPYNGKYLMSDGKFINPVTREPLILRQAREKEISANYFVESLGAASANTSREQTRKELSYSYSKPFSDFTMSDLRLERDTTLSLQKEYVDLARKNLSTEQIKNAQASYITNTAHSVSLEDASHNILFDLNWEKIVKDKVKNGSLIGVVNKNKHLQNLITITGTDTKKFNVENILRNCTIKEIIIKRHRLKDRYTASSKIGTPLRNKIEETMVVATIPNFSFVSGYSDDKVSLESVSNEISKKTLIFKDRELFTTNHKALYSYTIELVIDDKISEYFYSLIRGFRESLKTLDNEITKIENRSISDKYIKSKDKLHSFNQSVNYANLPAIGQLIENYMLILTWRGQQFSREEFIKTRANIFTMASDVHGGTISGLYKFRELCESLLYTSESLLESIDKPIVGSVTGSKKAVKEPTFQNIVLEVPGTITSISDGDIMVSYSPKKITNENMTYLGAEPDIYYYKTKSKFRPIISRAQMDAEMNSTIKENKLLILENALKTGRPGDETSRDLNTEHPRIKEEFTFGITGLSLTVPSSKGLFESKDSKLNLPSSEAEQDIDSNLSTAVKSSIALSTTAITNIEKLEIQDQSQDKEALAIKRMTTLRKTMKMLSTVKNHETKHKQGSSPIKLESYTEKVSNNLFEQKELKLAVAVPSQSAEMDFQEISEQSLSDIPSQQVILKILEPTSEYGNSVHRLVNNVYSVSKESIRNLLNEKG